MNYQEILVDNIPVRGSGTPVNVIVKKSVIVEDLVYMYARTKALQLLGQPATTDIPSDLKRRVTGVPHVSN